MRALASMVVPRSESLETANRIKASGSRLIQIEVPNRKTRTNPPRRLVCKKAKDSAVRNLIEEAHIGDEVDQQRGPRSGLRSTRSSQLLCSSATASDRRRSAIFPEIDSRQPADERLLLPCYPCAAKLVSKRNPAPRPSSQSFQPPRSSMTRRRCVCTSAAKTSRSPRTMTGQQFPSGATFVHSDDASLHRWHQRGHVRMQMLAATNVGRGRR